MHTDTLQLIDEWGPEKVVCVRSRPSTSSDSTWA
jgi:hypothetical protein